jgi:serine phosphatase RsbU (regulator of sigma subunit)
MSYWEDNPQTFKMIIAVAVIIIFAISIDNLYQNVTGPNDENTFKDLPANLYITKEFKSLIFKNNKMVSKLKIIYPGNLLKMVNYVEVLSFKDFETAINKVKQTDSLNLVLIDLVAGTGYEVKVLRSDISKDNITRVDKAAWIIEVFKGGASDQAGIKAGDIIIRVNGKSFSSIYELDYIMKHQKSGSFIYYELLRNNEIFEVKVQLAMYGLKFKLIAFTLVGYLTLIIGIFIGWKSPKLTAAGMISIAFILIGYYFTISINPYLTVQDNFTKVKLISIVFSLLFGIPVLLHSRLYFPVENQALINKQWVVLLLYLFSAIGFSLFTLSLFTFKFLMYVPNYTLIVIFIYYGIINLVYRKTYSKENKRYFRIIKISYIITVVCVALSSVEEIKIQYPYLIISVILVPLAYLYTIARYRLLDLDVKINRNLFYLIIYTIWHLVLLSILFVSVYYIIKIEISIPNFRITQNSIEILSVPLPAEFMDTFRNLINLVLGLFVLIILGYVRIKGNNLINSKFDRVIINFRNAYSEIFESLEIDISHEKLSQLLIDKIHNLIRFKRIGIIILENNNYFKYQYFKGFVSNEFEDFNSSVSRKLISVISQFQGMFNIDYLPEGIKVVYQTHGIKSLLPIKSKGTLLGAFLIGDKLSETSFTSDELELLRSTANQAAVSLDNALLYVKLTEQERMKHELDIARKIQLASLPQTTPQIQGIDVWGLSIPALEVGGDFYDYLIGNDRNLSVVIGDVSGKGTSSALYVSKTQGILNTLNEFELSPKEMLIRVNRRLFRSIEKNYFITASIIFFNSQLKKLKVARAGHLPLYYFNSLKDVVEIIQPVGIALGVSSDELFTSKIEEIQLDVNYGDAFLLISDGITDARNSAGNEFGENKVLEILTQNHNQNAKQIVDTMIQRVEDFTQSDYIFDDMTIVVLKICC